MTLLLVGLITTSLVFLVTWLMMRCARKPTVASGTLFVTGKGDIIIDENIPHFSGLLTHPHRHIVVKLDDDEPPAPPCISGEPDSVTWALLYKHKHDGRQCKNSLRLKVTWSVAGSRTITWRIMGEKSC